MGLPEQLRLVQASSKQLQAHFATPASETREQHAIAKNLSEPLYVLFRQLDALCGPDSASVVRIVDGEPFRATVDAVSTGVRGAPVGEEEGQGRKRAKTSAVGDSCDGQSLLSATGDAGPGDELEVDELAVLLTVHVPVSGHGDVSLTTRFQRLTRINAVTVEAKGCPGRLLSHLFPGDSGKDYPTSQHVHASGAAQFPRDAPARPFAWAQWLGGLNCLPESQGIRLEASSRMVFQRIHQRLHAHTLLEAQLSTLASRPHPIPVYDSAESLFPPPSQLLPKLTSWSEDDDPATLHYFCSASTPQQPAPASSSAASSVYAHGESSDLADVFGCRVFSAVFTGHKNSELFFFIGTHVTLILQDTKTLFEPNHPESAIFFQSESHEVAVLVTPAYPEVAPRYIIRPAGVPVASPFFDQSLKV